MKRQTALFFYVLSVYVVLQFAWWGFHLIELTKELSVEKSLSSRRVVMIIGEGSVFFLILLLGLWKIRNSIKKELQLSQQQNNFLLSVTHELKTPIAATRLVLQTLQRKNLSEEKREEFIAKALQESQRLESLVNNILNATRLSNRAYPLQKEATEVSVFLESIAQRYRKHHPDRTIQTEIQPSIHAQIDPFVIESVMNNLIENALKYTETDNSIIVYLTVKNDKIIFGVKDNGKGISKEEQEAIYKKFYRSTNEETRTQKGSGLGLYLASEFIKLHNGKLIYRDNQPTGANFEITL